MALSRPNKAPKDGEFQPRSLPPGPLRLASHTLGTGCHLSCFPLMELLPSLLQDKMGPLELPWGQRQDWLPVCLEAEGKKKELSVQEKTLTDSWFLGCSSF